MSEEHNWFWRLTQRVLRQYAQSVTLNFLRRKYPGLTREDIGRRRINRAARRAGLVGLLSGAAMSLAEASFVVSALGSLFSLFTAGLVTVPGLAISLLIGVMAFLVEVALILRIQLHLGYELFLLYDMPGNLDHPREARDITRVALGIKGAEIAGQAFQKLVPQVGDAVIQKTTRQFTRKYLGEGGLVRILVPGTAIFTAAAWDFLSTKSIGNTLRSRIEWRELATNEAKHLNLEPVKDPKLLLRSTLSLALTGRDVGENAFRFYEALAEELQALYGEAVFQDLGESSAFDWDVVMTDLAAVTDGQERRAVYEALTAMAAVEGRLSPRKRRRLRTVAGLFGLPLDALHLQARLAPYKEPLGGHACLYLVLALFLLMLYACLICGVGLMLMRSLVPYMPIRRSTVSLPISTFAQIDTQWGAC